MNFTSKNSRFSAIRENEPYKKREERNKEDRQDNRFKRDNSKSKNRRSRNEKPTFQEKLPEPKPVNPPPLTEDYYPTLGEAVSNKPSQIAQTDSVPKEETTWKDLIAKREEEENEAPHDPIQPGWIRLRMDKKTHKIIREYGPPVEDSGWFARWQDYERMLNHRRWLAYIEEQEEIRSELEPDYLYQREEFSDPEYDTDNEDILVEEECLSDEADSDCDY